MIGFSNGALKHLNLSTLKEVEFISQIQAEAIEISFNRPDRGFYTLTEEELTTIKKIASGYQFVSVHAPAKEIEYRNDEKTAEILNRLEWIVGELNPQVVVFHSDVITGIDLILRPKIPGTLENMDDRREVGRLPGNFEDTLQRYPDLGITLDITHVATIDPQCNSMGDILTKYGKRVKELHLSGFGTEDRHLPLFKTEQKEIIEAYRKAKELNVPVILEGHVDPENVKEELAKELEFVRNL